MDRERWDRVQDLFHQVADLPAASQRAALEQACGACGGDDALEADVLALLSEDARGGSLLDDDVAAVAQGVLQGPAPPVREIGPYRLRELLGEGGMGVVYLAEREDLGGALVAIKFLRDAWMSPARRQRFASEQRTLAQLNHPNIARLYDADTLPDGTPWFAMEYVDGVPLTAYCNRNNCSVEERLKLVRTVCEAVQYAHEQGVVHRDLKPSNILVKCDGSVRLLDFGIAKQLDALGRPVDQTRTAFRQMTPAYAAPEQLRGGAVGVHTDVYSLGVILYELLAGRLPYDISHQAAAEAMAIPMDLPARPSAAAQRVGGKAAWPDLDALCLTAMHEDPERRYPSAEGLVRDIDRYLNHEPLEARPDSLPYTAARFVRRNARALSAAVAMFALVAVAVALTLTVSRKPPQPASRTVAVLPFQNTGTDHSLDFLGLALPQEIATTLGYARSLSVRPFDTTSKYTEPNLNLQTTGQQLKAETIVTGHFFRAGDQLQVILEATDVAGNRLVWRDTLNVPAQNMITLEAQIAARARAGLAPVLGASEFVAESAAQPGNEEAYGLFLRSAALSSDPLPNKQAIRMLEQAVRLDPAYVPAWLAIAQRSSYDSWFGGGGQSAWDRAMEGERRALALEPNSVEAGAGLVVNLAQRRELAQAYRQAQDLIRRRPDSARAHFASSYVLRYAGLLDEAANECETSFVLDAQTGWVRACAVAFMLKGDYARAVDYIHTDYGSQWAQALTIDTLLRQGKQKEALETRLPSIPQWGGYDMLLAFMQHKPASEVAALAGAVKSEDDPEVNYFSAAHLAYSGQTSAALDMLKRAIDGGYCSYPALDSDPFLASLRDKPEFREMRSAAMACQKTFLAQRGQRTRGE